MYEVVVALLRPYTVLWLILLAAVVNLWWKRRETRGRLLLLTIAFAAVQLISTPAVAHLALGSLEWQYSPLKKRPADCQAIVVFAGGIRADAMVDGVVLADDASLRCLFAAHLYRLGPPCPILLSGGKADPDGSGPAHAHVMAEFLRKEGVPSADLIIEDTSRTTYENALHSARHLQERRFKKVLLVVDAVDMYRAAACLAKQGIDVVPAVSMYRAKPFTYSPLTLVPNEGAVRNCERVGHEWLGVVWYWWWGRL